MRWTLLLIAVLLSTALVVGLLRPEQPLAPGQTSDARTSPGPTGAPPTLTGVSVPRPEPGAPGEDAEAFAHEGFESLEAWIAHHRPRRLAGRVVDAKADPVPQAAVWIESPPTRQTVTAVTDASGRYQLHIHADDPRSPASYRVVARGPRGGVGSREFLLEEETVEHRVDDVVLEERGRIVGHVVDPLGQGIEGVRVRAYDETGVIVEMFEAGRRVQIGTDDVLTDAEGRFVLVGLRPHPHWVRVDLLLAPGQRVEPEELRGVHPDAAPLRLTLWPRARIGGRIVDTHKGEPVRRFRLNGVRHQDVEGRFEIGLPAEGRLQVTARGYVTRIVADLQLREGDALPDLHIGLEPDPDVGSLVIAARDLEGAVVGGIGVHGTGPDFVPWRQTGAPGDTEVRIAGLKPGRHTFWVSGEGWATVKAAAEIELAKTHRLLLTLERGGAIALSVVDATDAVARDVGLEVLDETGAPVLFHFVYRRPRGTLVRVLDAYGPDRQQLVAAEGRLEGMAAGRYTLRLYPPGHAAEHRDFVVTIPIDGEKPLRLRLASNAPR